MRRDPSADRARCKVDTMPVLVGDQGRFKSMCFRILSWGNFADTRIDLMNKDAYMQIHGVWLYEIAELDSFKKADTTRIRGFLSSQEDVYRPPFGHHVVKKPRQTVLCGTTNEEEFIDDPAGTRRFVPVRIGTCDPDWFRANVDQIWAEAVAMYDHGEIWWYDGESAERLAAQGSEFRDHDVWHDPIVDHLGRTGATETSISELLSFPLGITPDRQSQAHKNRVGAVLKVLGLKRGKQAPPSDGRGRVRIYKIPPGTFKKRAGNAADAAAEFEMPDLE